MRCLFAAAFWPLASAAACQGRIPPGAYTPSDDAEHERQADYVAANMLRTHTRRLHASWVKQTHRVLAAEAAWPIAPAHGLLALSSPLLPALWELGGLATKPCAYAQH